MESASATFITTTLPLPRLGPVSRLASRAEVPLQSTTATAKSKPQQLQKVAARELISL